MRSSAAVVGEPLPPADRIAVVQGLVPKGGAAAWVLSGIGSNERYVLRDEHIALATQSASLGRPAATCAALLPITKSVAWWTMSQDERREIFEEQSRHIRTGMRYLPAIARRLLHARDLGEPQPFDFLTWFEYAPSDAEAIDALLGELRASREWRYVMREVDVRLTRDQSTEPT